MKSRTSLFSPALFRKNVTRFSPLWGIFLGLLMLGGPVTIMNMRAADFKEVTFFLDEQSISAILYNLFYAPLCAALLFRYLHQPRAAYMMHAFPLNRSTQFCTNALTGFLFAAVPYALQYALNLLVSVGMADTAYLFSLFAIQLLSFLFFYGLALFCMFISGKTAISLLTYGASNFIFALLPLLAMALLQLLSFGFDLSPQGDALLYLMPLVAMIRGGVSIVSDPSWTPMLIYAAIGCVLIVLAWLHYRVRQIDQTGEAMAYKWARIVFLLVFTLSCTLGLGLFFNLMFGSSSASSYRRDIVLLLFRLCLAAMIGWFAALMMLKRTLKVFNKRTWRGWGIYSAVVVLLLCCVNFDVLGIQHYVPAQEDVKQASVTFTTADYVYHGDAEVPLTVTESADIGTLLSTHQYALEQWDKGVSASGNNLHVCYTLQDGRTVNRFYSVPNGSKASLSKLFAKPEYAVAYYTTLLDDYLNNTDDYFTLYDWATGERAVCTDSKAVRSAILQDAAAGDLPIPTLFDHSVYADSSYGLRCGNLDLQIAESAENTLALFEFDEPAPDFG